MHAQLDPIKRQLDNTELPINNWFLQVACNMLV